MWKPEICQDAPNQEQGTFDLTKIIPPISLVERFLESLNIVTLSLSHRRTTV
jgi:hypothetical protein